MRWMSLMAAGAVAFVVAGTPVCKADPVTFTAVMKGTNETPPNASAATGFATVTLSGDILTVSETFSGLTAPAAAAHIHCCAAPGTAASVVIPFAGFPAATSGTFNATFNLSTFTFSGGATEASFLAGLNAGLAYVNIHNVNFPGGEIRGQLVATPEPGSMALMATGLLGVAGTLRRRLRT